MSADLSVRPPPPNPRAQELLFRLPSAHATAAQHADPPPPPPSLSLFERIMMTHPPILESLLAQIPTSSVLDLYHTSPALRNFLSEYPLAWKTLSFRLPQPSATIGSAVTGSPAAHGGGTPDGRMERISKQYALDALLVQIVVPFGTRLSSLDLCNTAVSGVRLVSRVLEPRVDTIKHLSVRGCKNVSIKYHLVPFLEPYVDKGSPWAMKKDLALKSLYTYRCRHHRRRPYLPSSLARRDSDSEPTHQLIEICHQLGIWTDTAWCTTPGGRCSRRKDYYSGRAAPGTAEVWVPFDRLWRSGNRIGPSNNTGSGKGPSDGRLWEDSETGHDGEPLGTENGPFMGEGKDIPAHERRSHRIFVDDVKCDDCGDPILERCEQCSIRMHCMGCRKTLCASCAFNRPIPRKRKARRFTNQAFGSIDPLGFINTTNSTPSSSTYDEHSRGTERRKRNKFWWAPGLSRSPNLMTETGSASENEDESSSDENTGNGIINHFNLDNPVHAGNALYPPRLTMHWCCVEPVFSGGGGIVVLGPNVTGRGAERIRAAPLPRNQNFEDPAFSSAAALRRPDLVREMKNATLYEYVLGSDINILPYLQQESIELQLATCPRSLCQDCYRSFRWRVPCRACKKPLCKEHDFRSLKVRKCGYRDLNVEREWVREQPLIERGDEIPGLRIPAWKGDVRGSGDGDVAEAPGMVKEMSSGSMGSEAVFANDGLGIGSAMPGPSQPQQSHPSMSSSGLLNEPPQIPSASASTLIPPQSHHQQQNTHQQTDMTASLSSLLQLQQPNTNTPVPPPQPPVHGSHLLPTTPSPLSPRPRALSSSEPRGSRSASPWGGHGPGNRNFFGTGNSNVFGMGSSNMRDRLPLPGHPRHPVQWQGCGAYFCQALRPVGDCRPRCNAQMRECGGCGVLVCDGCLLSSPPCPCAVCTASYHCPSCSLLPSVRALCRRQDELAAMLAKEQEKRDRKRREEEARMRADELADLQREFFEGREEPESESVSGASVGSGAVTETGSAAAFLQLDWTDGLLFDEGEAGLRLLNGSSAVPSATADAGAEAEAEAEAPEGPGEQQDAQEEPGTAAESAAETTASSSAGVEVSVEA